MRDFVKNITEEIEPGIDGMQVGSPSLNKAVHEEVQTRPNGKQGRVQTSDRRMRNHKFAHLRLLSAKSMSFRSSLGSHVFKVAATLSHRYTSCFPIGLRLTRTSNGQVVLRRSG